MATSRLPGLNCSICGELLDNQKILNCAHTFCVKCLKSILTGNEIKCPLCREVTHVPDEQIENLHTNLTLSSVVDDLKSIIICNAQNDPTHQEDAKFFCFDCDTRFCTTCFGIHNLLSPNKRHKTITIEEHKRQILPPDPVEARITRNEEGRDTLKVCVDCNKFLSNSLPDRLHNLRKHTVVTESEYRANTKLQAQELQQEVTKTLAKIRTINTSYADIEEEVREFSYNVISNINRVYDDQLRHLQDWKLTTIKHCQNLQENASKRYDQIQHKIISDKRNLVESTNLVGSGLEDSHNITAFAELCDSLSRLLRTVNGRARDISLEEQLRVARSMSFQGTPSTFGELKIAKWKSSTKVIKVGKNMTDIDTDREGRIAISYFEGGVEFHEDGQDLRTVIGDMGVLGVAFLSDGSLVVRDVENKVQLFSKDMEPKNNEYRTISYEEGGDGCLAVDSDDNIYMNYRSIKKIHVFARKGGKVIENIDCSNYTPQQVAVLSKRQMLVMDGSNITMFQNGNPSSTQFMYPGCYGYPCVSNDGSLLVAWVDTSNKTLRIDKYTSDFKLISCVYSSDTIDLSGRAWYVLKELPSGNLVFCTNKKLHVLRQEQVCPEESY